MKLSLWISLAASLIGLRPVAARDDFPGDYPSSPPPLGPSDWERTPVSVFYKVLNTQPDPDYDLLKELVTYDCTYVSLTFDNPTLHGIMPWAGTHTNVGPQAFIDIFTRVGLYWDRGPFTIDYIFGDGGNVTAWGSFTATSRTLGKTVISPWAARAQVNSANQIFEFHWMEDTFTTASSFGSENSTKVFYSNPQGGITKA
ncbi:uncharacterized protein PGRI_065650 [Penicillium griseofulvum]|uniref:SnoaL-like domain-containing protein n=2 Tax=Penicillium patulum TaxID=5078 RepID=A0A135LPV6_PENPA|nr:uncharacterized protein PGRI_065650 [Penicillium griseofulvum]KXG50993.1 hypothetical protein PGRI_065650 [Penicillium griseofulvum]